MISYSWGLHTTIMSEGIRRGAGDMRMLGRSIGGGIIGGTNNLPDIPGCGD